MSNFKFHRIYIETFLSMDEPRRRNWRGKNSVYTSLLALFESRGWVVGRFNKRPMWAEHLWQSDVRHTQFPVDFVDVELVDTPSMEQRLKAVPQYHDRNERRIKSVYLISDGRYTKIGVALSTLERVYHLQVANPNKIRVIASAMIVDAEKVEQTLHAEFDAYHRAGEWFELTRQQQQGIASRLIDLSMAD